jgi:UDP-N-acetylglucosamine--N-acetylmuramyl-(pentapeptide) pyrophosphoryl-undecaprenol N-acetylglucosamine transferase
LQKDKTYRIILSGGGTGGHIFPAIAIANELRSRLPGVEILFVGALGKMEMDKVPRAGFRITGLPVSAFHRRLTLKNLAFPFRLLSSLFKASKVVRDFRPDLVIGTGGFASGPVLRVATRKGIPTMIQEQNSFPGVTNRLLAGRVTRICTAYSGMEKYFPEEKIRITGNPVRSNLSLPAGRMEEAMTHFGLRGDRPVILVFGGSQGARTLNQTLQAAIGRIGKSQVEVIWQTGTAFLPAARAAVELEDCRNIHVYEFINEMNLAYAVASLVVCRSGAITLSELALLGKPAILVPLPSAAEDHQTNNARAFVDEGAAVLVEDARARQDLAGIMLEMVDDPARLVAMSRQMARFARPQALNEIADEAIKLLTT